VSHAGKFFTSLAVQLAFNVPSLRQYICEVVTKRSDIPSLSLSEQWRQLVLSPLSNLQSESCQSYILVVDALDECENDKDVGIILQLLAEARSLTTVQLRVFLTSRPEIPIRYSMHYTIQAEHQDFILHNIPPETVNHDIFLFLEHNLRIIRQELTLGADWPGEVVVRQLVLYACGLLIWASTACRFIRDGMSVTCDEQGKLITCYETLHLFQDNSIQNHRLIRHCMTESVKVGRLPRESLVLARKTTMT
jgi:hypothetical protein